MSNEHNKAHAVPQGEPLGYINAGHLHEIQSGRVPYVYAAPGVGAETPVYTTPPQEPAVPHGWTDADSDAARLALELECLLLDTETLSVVSKWWASANEALELHRQRLATLAAPSQEPVTLTDDDIARCINVATCGRPFIGLMNSGGVPSAFSRSLADLLIAALREKEGK